MSQQIVKKRFDEEPKLPYCQTEEYKKIAAQYVKGLKEGQRIEKNAAAAKKRAEKEKTIQVPVAWVKAVLGFVIVNSLGWMLATIWLVLK